MNYVYRITNVLLNKHYYGCRTADNPILDLGIKYFSSSSDKEFISDQKLNRTNYKYKIIRTFDTRKEAILFEIKLHNKLDVALNESFYNRAKQTSSGFDTTGREMSELQKTKLQLYWNDENRLIKSVQMKQHCGTATAKKLNSELRKLYFKNNPEALLKLSARAKEQFKSPHKRKEISRRQVEFWVNNPSSRIELKRIKNAQAKENPKYFYYAPNFECSFYSISDVSKSTGIPWGTLSTYYRTENVVRTRGKNKGVSPRELGFFKMINPTE